MRLLGTVARGVGPLLIAALGGCAWFGGDEDASEQSGAKPETGPKAVIEVTGVEGDLANNVELFVSIASENCDAPEWRVERLLKRVENEASDAVRAYGYYEPEIQYELDRVDECWHLRVAVEPGEPVRIDSVVLVFDGDASEDEAFEGLVDRLPIKTADVLNHASYEAAKRQIATLAADRGYFDGRFRTSEFRVDVPAHSASVVFEYDAGQRYDFGAFTIVQDALRPQLVERMFDSPEGQPYSAATLNLANRQLSDTGYFADVIVRPNREAASAHAVPVTVTLEPLPQHSFTAGAGYSTDVGPRVRLGYENRRLNKRGHRWSARAEASALMQDIQFEYGIPLRDPRVEWLTVLAGYEREDSDNVRNRAARLGLRQTKKRPRNWLETRFLDFNDDDFDVGDQRGRTTMLVPGISWSRTEVDNRLDAGRGWRVSFDMRGALDGALSDASLFRAHLTGDWLRRLPWSGRVLTRAEVGALATPDFAEMPPAQRFFAGGDLSVRGYGYRDLGPTDSSSDAIGGRYVLTGSFEYEHPIKGAFSGAAFVDAGNVSEDIGFPDGFGVGVGLGVRWRSPVGPVRMDIAHPLRLSDDAFQIHLRLGPDL
ncbi:MAG: autotransporter assembly complex protein TamA [Gammaproteobacteria bacterium]